MTTIHVQPGEGRHYRMIDGDWLFERRRFHRWYQVDALERPAPGAGVEAATDPLSTARLPEAFPTWAQFWAEAAARRS